MTPRRGTALVLVALVVLLASCTTIPHSSTPQVVKSLGAFAGGPPVTITPQPGAEPHSIVQSFLDASGAYDPTHAAARTFLTAEGKNRWADSTITVLDHPFVRNAGARKVTVVGNEIGSVDDSGVYTPSLRGDGTGAGGVAVSVTFGMKQVRGEWRIDSQRPNAFGLLLSAAQFEQYQQHSVYFFDVSEQHLVPDPRYTELTDSRDLGVWLVARLAGGPRNGFSTGLPDQTDPKRVRVQFPADSATGDPTKIEIPGAAQLDPAGVNRLAAQIAATVGDLPEFDNLQITDGGVPVRVPLARGTAYTPAQVAGEFRLPSPPSALYYLHQGAVYAASGRQMPGKVGAGAYHLTSVALAPRAGSSTLQVAAVRGTGKTAVLDVGSPEQLFPTSVHGQLSRPAWAPDRSEIWIGAGTNLYRVSPTGVAHVVPVDAVGGKPSGKVIAVRLSPEGARVALVLASPDGTSQVYLGAVVRGATEVRVSGLAPISPQGVAVTDVAWNDELKLFAIGSDRNTTAFGVFELQCDGSLWTPRPLFGLPDAPDSVTVAANSVAVVSTGDTVWRQQAGAWEALHGDETRGTNPVYVE